MSLTHTFELVEVREATLKLISDNATHLINYIYDNKTKVPYNSQQVRIGLVMKTLLKTDTNSQAINSATLDLVINDLSNLISCTQDSRLTDVYTEELRFLRSCTILDDMITLNTNTKPAN